MDVEIRDSEGNTMKHIQTYISTQPIATDEVFRFCI